MTKDELKQAIMLQFERQNCGANNVIPMRYWLHSFLTDLNPKDQELFEQAANELIDEGKLRYEKENLECLRLTEYGFADLYLNSKSVQEIEEDIMDVFRRGNYRDGQNIMMRVFIHSYFDTLNPKEKPLFELACNNLIDKHYISYIKESPESLRLEQAGYDYIYK